MRRTDDDPDTATASGVSIFTVPAAGGAATELPLHVGRFNGDPAYPPDGSQISFDQDTSGEAVRDEPRLGDEPVRDAI